MGNRMSGFLYLPVFFTILSLFILLLSVLRLRAILKRSLPVLSGVIKTEELSEGENVRIETDSLGIPRITASSYSQIAFGLGYVHARDRFFQMDLARRFASGELAELLGGGKSVVETDKAIRRYRFRHLCQNVIKQLNSDELAYLKHYTAGVNQALRDLKGSPWEYRLLKSHPRLWILEDSLLVSQSITLFLEGGDLAFHQAMDLIHRVLPKELAEFLTPPGSGWDCPIVGDAFPELEIPPPSCFNLRDGALNPSDFKVENWSSLETKVLGSNAWAVSGTKAHGGKSGPALVANDMHLGLGLPPTWYKVSIFQTYHGSKPVMTTHGVTLPGAPPVIAGSNGYVAWGLTSAQGDWGDLLVLELDPQNPRRYRTPDGWLEMKAIQEKILIKGGSELHVQIDWTIWGPVVDEDLDGRRRVWRWVAQELDGTNLNIQKLSLVQNVHEAIQVAASSGVPHVNFLVGDKKGNIAWTIMGRIPKRLGFGLVDERLPMLASDCQSHWDGFLDPEEYPKVINPPDGLLWSANHRMVDGDMLQKIGRGRYDRGVRATRIHQLLQSCDRFDEQKMLEIQQDHKALLMHRWRDMLLEELTPELAACESRRVTFRNLIGSWSGQADSESVAYALLNECRLRIVAEVISPLVHMIHQAEVGREKPVFRTSSISLETPVWQLLRCRPIHLLSPRFESWESLILSCIDQTIDHASENGWPTWGDVNRVRICHPFAKKIPLLKHWICAPEINSSGSLTDMPGVQSPAFGASQRLAVFPGRETEAIMQMPGGQSAHPLSQHFLDHLQDWLSGGRSPLVAGNSENILEIRGTG